MQMLPKCGGSHRLTSSLKATVHASIAGQSGRPTAQGGSLKPFVHGQLRRRDRMAVGHRVIDLATLVHGTKSPWRFNAGG
ncbi:MAG: hypothetical protein EOP20_03890 [Hyphomicrobiales bacterium]|nr:MAG: hypothetical protein EOP20_03890 [Hyphomicrobiales bacterium]